MSIHAVKIVEITEIKEHPNADRLEIIPVGEWWQCVSQKGTWSVGDKAVYIEPDYVVPTSRPEFSFLSEKESHRLKAVKLRGELSYGLLVPLPADLMDCSVGDDVMVRLGITRYVPPESLRNADALPRDEWPILFTPKFDVESFQNYRDLIGLNESVVVTEKIHGANARYVFHDGKMCCGSRNQWVKNDGQNAWSKALINQPAIEQFCTANPDHILYGEIFGPVQSLKYGRSQIDFLAFGLQNPAGVMFNPKPFAEMMTAHSVPQVPVIFTGLFRDLNMYIAEMDSVVSTVPQMMEGMVIAPVDGRTDPEVGWVLLKYISDRYWLKK